MKKKICIITTNRADYGFFKPLISEIKTSDKLELEIIACGTHLEKKYGSSIEEILQDNLKPIIVKTFVSDSENGIVETIANTSKKIGEELIKTKPDMVILVGDRYETLTIAHICAILNIPIAHISGGDVTAGANDDMFRHAITKLSYLHFTACQDYQKRVIQLGEEPNRVFNVGALSLENIKRIKLLTQNEIEEILQVKLDNCLVATFHPVTMEKQSQENQLLELLKAIKIQEKYHVIFTLPNPDHGREILVEILKNFAKEFPKKIKIFESLGVLNYLSAMKYCAGVIGNSSSGIIETPSFKIATINIGSRQEGRVCADSIINCQAKFEDIILALEKISSINFKEKLKNTINPFEQENTARKIVKIIEDKLFNPIIPKKFYDLKN